MGYLTPNGQLKNIHTGDIIQAELVIFVYLGINKYICIYVCVFIHLTTTDCGYEFEREQRMPYGRVWRDERDRGN